jgi:hypothetical protein
VGDRHHESIDDRIKYRRLYRCQVTTYDLPGVRPRYDHSEQRDEGDDLYRQFDTTPDDQDAYIIPHVPVVRLGSGESFQLVPRVGKTSDARLLPGGGAGRTARARAVTG